jgi:mono/diheme cytochrome c family protein/glucose/arabinose dehydrogenase
VKQTPFRFSGWVDFRRTLSGNVQFIRTFSFMMVVLVVLIVLFTGPVQAQLGDSRDTPGALQTDPIPLDRIPPSPPLSPELALKTFRLQPGFHVELAACEPLVHDPIALTFGADGRVWVVEMSGYMPNVDGVGEDQPVGKIVVLEDPHGDGHLDRRIVFADHLVLPRAIALVGGGLLVGEPPHLWFYPIIDGNKAGRRSEVASDFGSNYSPEDAPNGLMWGLDNWIYCACYATRFRYADGDWQRGATILRGEWGIAQDDFGRIVYNSNEDQFRIDLVPAEYLLRNPNYRFQRGARVDPIEDQTVWPMHMTPCVNRGYWKNILRPDGTLAKTTAACGPLIYRGDNFPPEFRGNAFVCEPAGNLIIRDILVEKDGLMTGHKAYLHEDFLASTDERFRPTSLYNGPDGALYITDLYRGVLEHRISVTTYLRRQIKSRSLEHPLGLGRIYRVFHGDAPPRLQRLAELSSAQLVGKLASPEGWVQDTAQRLLVERANASVAPALRLQAIQSTDPVTQVHSAWTLEGMNQLDVETVLALLSSARPKVRANAVRLSERFLKSPQVSQLLARLLALAEADADPGVLRQLAFTFGQVAGADGVRGMLAVADRATTDPLVTEALASGLSEREPAFLDMLVHHWQEQRPGHDSLLGVLAECVVNSRNTQDINHLLELAVSCPGWRQDAILEGIATRVSPESQNGFRPKPKPMYFTAKPAGLIALEANEKLHGILGRITPLIAWPGKPGYVPSPPLAPLTAASQQRFDLGRQLFAGTCAACHQPTGLGQSGLAPPLADSEWVLGPEQRLARILLQGAEGPMTVAGTDFDSSMPSWAAFDDNQLAGILTYIRRSWENAAPPVEPKTIAAIRAGTAQRRRAWTTAELSAVH